MHAYMHTFVLVTNYCTCNLDSVSDKKKNVNKIDCLITCNSHKGIIDSLTYFFFFYIFLKKIKM